MILCTLFFLHYTFIGAQEKHGEIEYKKIYLKKVFSKDKKMEASKLEKFSKFEKMMSEASEKIVFNLIFNNGVSIFKASDFLESPDNLYLKMGVGPDGSGIFYNSKNERLRQLNAFGDFFLISKLKYDWVLKNETKKIGEYVCNKAVLIEKTNTRNGIKKNKIVAWYAPEINVPFGPIGYSDLPGLILELEKGNVKYFVSKIKLHPQKEKKIVKPTKGKKVTKKEFQEIGLKTMSDFRKTIKN